MKITVTIPRSSTSVDAELLVRFALKRLSEIDSEQIEPPPVLIALILAAGSHCNEFYERLTENIISSSEQAVEILRMCRDLFVPALWGQSPADSDRAEENPFPDEDNCNRVLHYALAEGRRMLAEEDFEFLGVFEFLTRTGLFCYAYRLYEFEFVRESCGEDSENLIRRGVEIIRTALGSPQEEN